MCIEKKLDKLEKAVASLCEQVQALVKENSELKLALQKVYEYGKERKPRSDGGRDAG